MKTWIWPFSLYCRIHDLEAIAAHLTQENTELSLRNRSLANQLAAESIAHAGMVAGYSATLTSVMEECAHAYKQRVVAENRDYKLRWERHYEAMQAASKTDESRNG